jgi:hypothetical protein
MGKWIQHFLNFISIYNSITRKNKEHIVGHMHYLSRNGCIDAHLSFQSMGTSCFVTISGNP